MEIYFVDVNIERGVVFFNFYRVLGRRKDRLYYYIIKGRKYKCFNRDRDKIL